MSRALANQIVTAINALPASIVNQAGQAAYVHIRDEKAVTTDGGTFTTGAWQTRDLNTEVSDADSLAAVSANQITLQPGIYVAFIRAPCYNGRRHQARLQNITDASTELLGSSAYSETTASAMVDSIISGRFSITTAKVFEVQHQCQTTVTTFGFGLANDFDTEVYTSVEFFRIGDA